MIILSCLKLSLTVEHSIIGLFSCSWGKKLFSECVVQVSNVKKQAVMFT